MALLMIHIKTKTCPPLWKIIKLSLQFLLRGHLLIFYSTSADGLLGMVMIRLSLKLHLRDHLLNFYGTSVVMLAGLVMFKFSLKFHLRGPSLIIYGSSVAMFGGQGQNTLECCLNFNLSFIYACLIELCYSATCHLSPLYSV